MIALLILWIVSVLAGDAGHHGLEQLGQIVTIIAAIFYTLAFLGALVSDD